MIPYLQDNYLIIMLQFKLTTSQIRLINVQIISINVEYFKRYIAMMIDMFNWIDV